ncbi:MAG: diguanylate cyclase [Gemmatimonadetes bacterium]|nr:diguanylate cyclase [Gemmatimonadota bacterium]MDA1104456.1 diguanylate cyclase [Gemmatimonadota bacterium]
MLGSDAHARDYARSHPALTDAETGLANRLHFELVYNYMFEAGHRGMPFTVMLVSVGAGDGAPAAELRALGQAIEKVTRNADLVCHVGSGRYAVLLLGTNLQGARIAADRVESSVTGLATGVISFGLAVYRVELKDSQKLLEEADRALLAAEAGGGGVEFG